MQVLSVSREKFNMAVPQLWTFPSSQKSIEMDVEKLYI